MAERVLISKTSDTKWKAPPCRLQKPEQTRSIKSSALQAKLRIGQPNDVYEQEADRVAEQIMRMPDPVIQRRCDKCDEDEKKVLQTKKTSGQASLTKEQGVPPIVHDVLRSPGQPLDSATRAFMEPRFGHDFSGVRVHTDSKAAESTKEVNALAYTVGRDVVLDTESVGNHTLKGKKLLAHELTHVVQQTALSTLGMAFQRQGAKGKTSTPTPTSPVPTVDCTNSNISEISVALPIARTMVRHAIDVLGRAPTPALSALLNRYFNDDSASTYLHVRIGYLNLLAGIGGSFTIECEQPGSFMYRYFCDGVSAYVRPLPGANVHLCGGAFGRSSTDLAETIVHESSHRFDNTDDEAYCWGGCPATLDRWDAYDNADSFSKFARDAYLTIP